MVTKSIFFLLATLAICFIAPFLRETIPESAPAPAPSPTGSGISMAAWAWIFQFSAAVPANPTQAGAAWYFDFPVDCEISPALGHKPCSVNYLITAFGGAIAYDKTISMNYQIDVTGSPVFNYAINPDNTCGPGSPGTMRLYFQQAGDNLSGIGPYEFYRWFSTPVTLAPGPNTLSAVLAGAKWISVYGKPGNDLDAAAGFAGDDWKSPPFLHPLSCWAWVGAISVIGVLFGSLQQVAPQSPALSGYNVDIAQRRSWSASSTAYVRAHNRGRN